MFKVSLFALGGFTGLYFGIYLRDKGFTNKIVSSYFKFTDKKNNIPLNIDEDKLLLKFNKMIDEENIIRKPNIAKEQTPNKAYKHDVENLREKHKEADVFFDYSTTKLNKNNRT